MMKLTTATLLTAAFAQYSGSGWPASAVAQAKALMQKMSVDQKISLLHGNGDNGGDSAYVGSTTGIPALGIPNINLEDGPQGVADQVDNVTCWPSALTATMSWDVDIMYAYGQAMGREQAIKGSTVMLGPGVNLARVPWAGRNFEYMGEDPWLASKMAVPVVQGVQSNNISACIKHYVFNNQEHNRDTVSANVPQRAAKELYFPPFHAAVDAGVGTAMCSYNRVNNTYACENNVTLNTELKEIGGFQGWIMSDWWATQSTVPSALSGLDMEQPDQDYFGLTLALAVALGQVNQSVVDGMVTRILTTHFALNMIGGSKGNLSNDARSPAHTALARHIAASGTTLLTNNGILPLNVAGLNRVAVLGDVFTVHGYGSGGVYPGGYISTPYQGLYNALNQAPPPTRPQCSTTNGQQYTSNSSVCLDAPSAAVCGSWCMSDPACGAFTFIPLVQCNGWDTPGGQCWPMAPDATTQPTNSSVVSGTCGASQAPPTAQVTIDSYMGSDMSRVSAVASAADIVVVSVATACSEGEDRPDLNLPSWQNQLVAAAAAANPRTVVVIRAPGPVFMPWLSSVAAVVYQLMPGQEAGHALADVLLGTVNPSGKLPVTFPNSMTETWLGSGVGQWPTNQSQYPGTDRGKGWEEADYSEGLLMGYRWYDAQNIEPLFPFGHGLSYTSWSYSNLLVTGSMAAGSATGAVTISCTLTNVGLLVGAEVVQLYIGYPTAAEEPPKLLKGFQKLTLDPGQSVVPAFPLVPFDLSIWNVTQQAWTLVPGTYTVMVGSSSRDIRVTGSFAVSP